MDKKDVVIKLIREKDLKIFVINYFPLKERRDYLKKRFKEMGLDKFVFWFIQKPGQYTEKEFSKFNFISQEEWTKRVRFVDGPKKILEPNTPELNLYLNHVEIYKKIIQQKIPVALVLEDDVILEEDFLDRLIKCLQELPKDFDMVYTDNGIYLRFPESIDRLEYFKYRGPLTRATASYFVSLDGAKKNFGMEKTSFPHDLDMRYFERKDNLKVYWLNGYLTYQGSVYGGYYKTVLQAKDNPLFFRRMLLSIESRRFSRKFLSQLMVLFTDYVIVFPYRKLRVLFKNRLTLNQ